MAKLQVSTKGIAGGLGTLIFLVALVSAGYFYYQYQEVKKNPAKLTQQEIQDLEKRVGKLIELPTDEDPQLATVTDVETVKQDQEFFKNALNGDKVLIYAKAKKAILYRPSTNKIIEVGPVTFSDTTNAGTSTLTSPAKVVLLNGTDTPGITSRVEGKLANDVENVTVTRKDVAQRKDYTKTLVVNLGNSAALAQQIASAIDGEVSALPAGEDRPSDADILIIVGQ